MKPQPKKIEKIDAPKAWGQVNKENNKLCPWANGTGARGTPYGERVRILKEADYRKLLRAWRGK